MQSSWQIDVKGVKMFHGWSKLKLLREKLRTLSKHYAQTQLKVTNAKAQVDSAQNALNQDPLNKQLF